MNMRSIRMMAVAVGLAAMTLAGCATTNPVTGVTTTTTPTLAQIISDVQTACTTACKFVPTASTIAGIVSAGNPGVIGASAIASAICAAIEAAPPLASTRLSRGKYKRSDGSVASVSGVLVRGWMVSNKYRGNSAVPMVNGVPIKGYYVN